MDHTNRKSLDEVLAEVAEDLVRWDAEGPSRPLPRYTDYGGLRVVESGRSEDTPRHDDETA
jgi:hypothetical protein